MSARTGVIPSSDVAEPVRAEISHGGFRTVYHCAGEGRPLLLIHGSGPGVSALANWRGTMGSELADSFRMIAPDVVGFGETQADPTIEFTHSARVEHLVDFLDALGLDGVDVIGNSMGGALALALAHRQPNRVRRMVLMGTVGIGFPISPGLEAVWGYEPSEENLASLFRIFAFDQTLVSPELVRLRHEASIAPGVHERYAAAFAAPRQRHLDAMALPEDDLRQISTPTLLVHGAEDQVIPLQQTSLRLVSLLPAADLVVFGRCGHWTQIERAAHFVREVAAFLGD
ncbi:alpha/beta fold hydrolase [Pseudonocardia acidicola]|uniref:Alpha/beta fold hydrolase n=1 Tax=Pseudonocardia acidicola TaxID=2724939 RepID=A0ABX1S8V2_9PSEU|nr:alpha/beta hydrolase [Pseudonocardia acidicola]NMH97334.1 alpha/beta fold hydrolase [Pseudonocardia acidicola]